MTTSPASGADRLPLPAYGAADPSCPDTAQFARGLVHATTEALEALLPDLTVLNDSNLTTEQRRCLNAVYAGAVAIRLQAKQLADLMLVTA